MSIPEIILASESPRRRMLLRQVGISFIAITPNAVEITPVDGRFRETVISNSEAKVRSVVEKADGRLILGADTIVDLDGAALGKPNNHAEARSMLQSLSGRDHIVHSGVSLFDPVNNKLLQDHVLTHVWFRRLRDEEIDLYIRSGEPMDKAGSYGIQERGALFIERIEGCFFNVMGLPLARTWEMLLEMVESD